MKVVGKNRKKITCDMVLRLLFAISLRELNKGSSPGSICLNSNPLWFAINNKGTPKKVIDAKL